MAMKKYSEGRKVVGVNVVGHNALTEIREIEYKNTGIAPTYPALIARLATEELRRIKSKKTSRTK